MLFTPLPWPRSGLQPVRRHGIQYLAAHPGSDALLADVARHREAFLEAMDDDFNTGGATGALFDLVRRLNKFVDDEKLEESGKKKNDALESLRRGATTLRELGAILGLFRKPVEQKGDADDELVDKLNATIADLDSLVNDILLHPGRYVTLKLF